MDVAIRGDRGSCITQAITPNTYLFAVASGFGRIEGDPVEGAVLARLQHEVGRRGARSKNLSHMLANAIARVNDEVHARTASHDDYVSAACSLTAVLLSDNRAFLSHVGSTGAYLARESHVVSLTKHDAFESEKTPVLLRALGVCATIETSSCSFALADGDTLVLTAGRLRGTDERRRLLEVLESGDQRGSGFDHMLIIRYGGREQVPPAPRSHSAHSVVMGIAATIMFYAMLCVR